MNDLGTSRIVAVTRRTKRVAEESAIEIVPHSARVPGQRRRRLRDPWVVCVVNANRLNAPPVSTLKQQFVAERGRPLHVPDLMVAGLICGGPTAAPSARRYRRPNA